MTHRLTSAHGYRRLAAAALLASLPLAAASPGKVSAAAAARSDSHWTWPVDAPRVVLRGFQRPPARWRAGHRGIDLAASYGDPVYAAGDGVVSFIGRVAGKGVVSIQHGSLATTYESISATVKRGQRVARGEQIGTVAPGASHCSPLGTPICLHWGLRRGREYLDPRGLFARHARLLPLGSAAPNR